MMAGSAGCRLQEEEASSPEKTICQQVNWACIRVSGDIQCEWLACRTKI